MLNKIVITILKKSITKVDNVVQVWASLGNELRAARCATGRRNKDEAAEALASKLGHKVKF